jgi:hypothetical protein
MANLIVSAVAEWNGKALKKGAKDVSAFDKGVKKLGKSLAGLFAAQKIAQFGKASVKAFAEDQAAAVKLAKAVDNLGLSYSNPDIANFIGKLETQSGIIDDKLRPSFQALLTTTGDVAKAQQLLTSAIDISRGSGIDLATVSQDLANGYVGITRGLKKYNLGLTQTQLKSKSFEEIMTLLNKQFSGASAAYLNTYTGGMEKFTTEADKAKEIVGKGLIDSLLILSGNTSVSDLADDMHRASVNTAELLVNLSKVVKYITGPFVAAGNVLAKFIEKTQPLADLIFAGDPSGFMDAPAKRTGKLSTNRSASPAGTKVKADQVAAARVKADAKNLAIQKELNKTIAATAKISKQSAMTDKQKLLFNQTAISAIAALKGKLTEEERNKVELMLALEMDNIDAAAVLSQKVAQAYDSTGQLALFLRTLPDAKNPFAAWDRYLDAIQAKASQIITSPTAPTSPINPSTPVIPSPVIPKMGEDFAAKDFVTLASQGAGASGGFSPVVAAAMAAGGSSGITQNFVTTVNNPVGNGVVDMVQQAILDASRLGHNLVPAGSL